MQLKVLIAIIFVVLSLSACTSVAPPYRPSLINAQQLKKMTHPLALGEFSAEKPELEKITVRASTFEANDGSFSAYLKNAIKSELVLASMLGTEGDAELTATLLTNELNTSNLVTGEGKISARFFVIMNKALTYDKVREATITFPSSFFGAHAIPNAINAYPDLVQRLIETLYLDQDFAAATNK